MLKSCQSIQREVLDRDWNQASLNTAREILDHLDGCEACRCALEEYDELRSMLKCSDIPPSPEIDTRCAADNRRPSSGATHTFRPAWAVALAASLLCIIGWTLYLGGLDVKSPKPITTKPSSPVSSIPQESSAALTAENIEQNIQVFDTVSEVFDGKASWVALAGESAEMGLLPETNKVDKDNLILLRLGVWRDGKVISNTDLVVVPGQTARFSVPMEHGQKLHYQIVASDKESSLLAELRDGDVLGEALVSLATTRSSAPGRVQDVGRLVTDLDDYKLTMACAAVKVPGRRP